MAKTRHVRTPEEIDFDRILADLRSADDAARAKAVRAVCPCRMGWKPYEQCMAIVTELRKDPSRLVRRAALHVTEEAYELDSDGLPTSRRETRDEIAVTRRRERLADDGEAIARRKTELGRRRRGKWGRSDGRA